MAASEQQFHQLLHEHGKMLRHLVCGYEANAALQDELFQDIALAIWTALPTYRGDCGPRTFLARIAQNRLARHVDKNVKRVKTESLEQALPESIGHGPNLDDQMASNQRVNRLLSAVRQLKLEDRELVSLALEGFSYQDIADVSGLTVNNIGVRLSRAKVRLKTLLEGE